MTKPMAMKKTMAMTFTEYPQRVTQLSNNKDDDIYIDNDNDIYIALHKTPSKKNLFRTGTIEALLTLLTIENNVNIHRDSSIKSQ